MIGGTTLSGRKATGGAVINGKSTQSAVAAVIGAFEGHAFTSERFKDHNFWPVGMGFASNGDLHVFVLLTSRHATLVGTQNLLVEYRSRDRGLTFYSRKTVYSNVDRPITAASMGKLANGRFGGVMITHADGATAKPRRTHTIYSDNWETLGSTWTVTEQAGLVLEHFNYGSIIPLSAQYGGHDVEGFFCGSYAGADTIKALKTNDNLETLTESTLLIPPAGEDTQEAAFIEVEGRGWIMFYRGQTNVYASISADFVNWSAGVDTGVELGSNNIGAFVTDGVASVTVSHRSGFTGPRGDNTVVQYTMDAVELYQASGVLTSADEKTVLQLEDRGISYWRDAYDAQGRRHIMTKSGETNASTSGGSRGSLAFISAVPVINKGQRIEPLNIFDNGDWSVWENADDFTDLTVSNTLTVDRLKVVPSGAVMTVSKTVMEAHARELIPGRPYVAPRITSTGDNYSGFSQDHSGPRARGYISQIVHGGHVTMRIYGVGQMPTGLRYSLTIDTGVGGSSVAGFPSSQLLVSPMSIGESVWVAEVTIDVPNIADLVMGEGASLRHYFFTVDGGAWDFIPAFIGVYVGDNPFNDVVLDYSEQKSRCDEYV